jgi:hypothetical protein
MEHILQLVQRPIVWLAAGYTITPYHYPCKDISMFSQANAKFSQGEDIVEEHVYFVLKEFVGTWTH